MSKRVGTAPIKVTNVPRWVFLEKYIGALSGNKARLVSLVFRDRKTILDISEEENVSVARLNQLLGEAMLDILAQASLKKDV